MGRFQIGCVASMLSLNVAYAAGSHVDCQLQGIVQERGKPSRDVTARFQFYLDDTREQLVDESPFGVVINLRTTLYSDTRVQADVNNAETISIDRTSGRIVLLGGSPPGPITVQEGTCKQVRPTPKKF